jgi:Uma2 family endonuclease
MPTLATFTLEQYEHMVLKGAFTGPNHRRVELLRGEIVEMSPISPMHNWLVSELNEWSMQVVDLNLIRISVQGPIRIPEIESEPEPDIVWAVRKNYRETHAEPADVKLLIEVSGSSLAYDRGDKLSAYAEAGILDYWIVNFEDEQVEVYRSPQGRNYRDKLVVRGDETIAPLADETIELRVGELFRPPTAGAN